jgi:hypothetical protein
LPRVRQKSPYVPNIHVINFRMKGKVDSVTVTQNYGGDCRITMTGKWHCMLLLQLLLNKRKPGRQALPSHHHRHPPGGLHQRRPRQGLTRRPRVPRSPSDPWGMTTRRTRRSKAKTRAATGPPAVAEEPSGGHNMAPTLSPFLAHAQPLAKDDTRVAVQVRPPPLVWSLSRSRRSRCETAQSAGCAGRNFA